MKKQFVWFLLDIYIIHLKWWLYPGRNDKLRLQQNYIYIIDIKILKNFNNFFVI